MAEEIEWNQRFFQYSREEDFSEEDRNLINIAKEASEMAYAPYSKFHVGAALLLEDGTVITGANQENAAYPEGSCAERVAFGKAATTGKRQKIIAAAVVALKDGELVPASPCGGCRQVMLEVEVYQKEPLSLIMLADEDQWIKTKNVKSLLPFSFKL